MNKNFDKVFWLAFRMSGFCGLYVPEKVYEYTNHPGAYAWECSSEGNSYLLRTESDGKIFTNEQQCIDYCKETNEKNPFYRKWLMSKN